MLKYKIPQIVTLTRKKWFFSTLKKSPTNKPELISVYFYIL
jgi:hypothetical protein